MAGSERSLSRDEQQKLGALLRGVVDGILEQPETKAAFEDWHTVIAEEAKAAELAYYAGRRRRNPEQPRSRRRREARTNFIEASLPRWEARINISAEALIRRFEFPLSGVVHNLVRFDLTDRFTKQAATRADWPRRTVRLLTDLSPRIGEQFQFTIPADWAVSRVRAALRPPKGSAPPTGSLLDFVACVDARIRAVEKAMKAKPGRPVSDYKDALRRDGRWLFLVETRRTKVEELAETYHQEQGTDHALKQGVGICDNCVRTVRRRLGEARRLLRRRELARKTIN